MMKSLLDITELGSEIAALDPANLAASVGVDSAARAAMEAYYPMPQTDGNLCIDPEIHLPSIGMDVDIAYYYNALLARKSTGDHAAYPYGLGRTISVGLVARWYGDGSPGSLRRVELTRGNGSKVIYQEDSNGNFSPASKGVRNKLVFDTTSLFDDTTGQVDAYAWVETTPDGRSMWYKIQVDYPDDQPIPYYQYDPDQSGFFLAPLSFVLGALGASPDINSSLSVPTVHYFDYDANNPPSAPGTRLTTLTDTVGNVVTFSYTDNSDTGDSDKDLLQSITDWGGRITTFTYLTDADNPPLLQSILAPDGAVTNYDYDATTTPPLLSSITDPKGLATTYTYDDQGRVQTRTLAWGHTTTFTYSSSPNKMSVQDALGLTLEHDLDENGWIIGLKDAQNTQVTFTRNDFGQQTSRTDPVGTTTTMYDAVGNPTVKQDALGRLTTLTWDAFNNLTSVTAANGAITTYIYTGEFDTTGSTRHLMTQIDPLGGEIDYHYDDFYGRLTSVENEVGNTTTYEYDDLSPGGQVSIITNPPIATDPLGTTNSFEYDTFGNTISHMNELGPGYVSTFTYDTQNRMTSSTDPLGHITTMAYDGVGNRTLTIDPLGRRTTYTYHNPWNKPDTITDAQGHVTTMLYDALGRTKATIDPLGHVTTTMYNQAGLVCQTIDALGHATHMDYDAGYRLQTVTDPRGFVTTMLYDAAGQMYQSTDAQGHTTQMLHDAVGQVYSTIDPANHRTTTMYDLAGRQTGSVDARGYVTTMHYDAAGRQDWVQDARGHFTHFTHDAMNRLETSTAPTGAKTTYTYDNAGQTTGVMDALGHLSASVYDPARRVTQTTTPLGHVTTYVYDAAGQQTQVLDPLGHIMTNVYDPVGRVQQVIDARGSMTSFVYDPAGRRTALVDAVGNRTTSSYDARGSVLSSMDPKGALTTYTYDEAANLTQQLDPLGQLTQYTIDGLGRTTNTDYPASPPVTDSFNPDGTLQSRVDATGLTLYSYDASKQLQSVQNPSGTTLTYTYDAVGNRLMVQDGAASISSYTYDAGNRLATTHNPLGELTTHTYDLLDRPARQTLASGMVVSHAYDHDGRLIYKGHLTHTGQLIASFAPTYDAADRQTGQAERFATPAQNMDVVYGYDAASQLTREQRTVANLTGANAYTLSYSYDAAGNRLTRSQDGDVTLYTYGAGNQLQTRTDPDGHVTTYTYDDNGNQIAVQDATGVTTYTWDEENRLREVLSPNSAVVTYLYDATGLRINLSHGVSSGAGGVNCGPNPAGGLMGEVLPDCGFRAAMTPLEDFPGSNLFAANAGGTGANVVVWNGDNLLLDSDALGRPIRYTDDPDSWGGLVSLHTSEGSGFYVFDPQGHARQLIAADGQTVTDTYLYTAFGERVDQSGSTFNRLQYGGQFGYQADSDGRLYVRARHLDVENGRWITRDPIGFEGGINLYGYVDNNPMMESDPSGMDVGSPGFAESLIPVWGSGREAIHDFQAKQLGKGVFNTVLAVSDVFLVKAVIVDVGKVGFKGLIKVSGSHSWSATKSWLIRNGWREYSGQPFHHWLLERNQGIGRLAPDWLKNQPWNLVGIPRSLALRYGVRAIDIHNAIHGNSLLLRFNVAQRLWYGTPVWVKPAVISGIGRGINRFQH